MDEHAGSEQLLLHGRQDNTAKDVKQLEKKLTGLHADMGRFNALIATHKELQTMLSHDAFNLERRIANELQVRPAGQALELLLIVPELSYIYLPIRRKLYLSARELNT